MKDFSLLEKKLGVTFKNQDFLITALTHRSYLNENPKFRLPHNERLEFLGDAVLELAVTKYLYNSYPDPEGELTNWRAALVNANMLSQVAQELDLEDFLLLSKGEAKDKKSKARLYILANAFEAVTGAIYLDRGFEMAEKFIEKVLLWRLKEIIEKRLYLDPKSRFQEAAQEFVGITPSYKVLEEAGPDHAKWFRVGVYLGDEFIAEGEGSSKHEAQVQAASRALEVKNW
jgi:ribonuclease-3